ncbi:MAG: MarR family winged helix-turn-helix transcriptional regulator [Pseudonocardia sp.]|nr:MarR family winged helix-turn-helix transcriptional regulator [Pseudonocardia sp.]
MTTGSFEAGWFEPDPALMPLSKLLPWTGRSLSRYHQRCAAAHGLTSTSMGVLGVLGHADAVSHRELAAHLGVTPATLTPVVDALEATGDLARVRDAADRRVVHLSLTVQGRGRLTAAFAQVATAFRERLPHPPPEHHEIIRGYLLAVLAAVAEEAPG